MHILNLTPLLAWEHRDLNGTPQDRYRVEVRNAPNGTGFMYDFIESAGNASTYLYKTSGNGTNLSKGSVYYFRARTSSAGNWSNWSEMRFRLNTAPNSPTNLDPVDGAVLPLNASQRVRWAAAYDQQNDTLVYEWLVDTERPAAGPHVSRGNTTSLISAPFATLANTTYYWWVRAFDGYELSPWSNFNNGTDFSAFQPNRAPTVDPANITAPAALHPVVFEEITAIYEDPDGEADLLTLWLRVSAGAQNFSLRGFNGPAATGIAADIFGEGAKIAVYDRAPGAPGLAITWRFLLDWSWHGRGPISIEARAMDRFASTGPWVSGPQAQFDHGIAVTLASPKSLTVKVGESVALNGTVAFPGVTRPIEFFQNITAYARLGSPTGPAVGMQALGDANLSMKWGPKASDVGTRMLYVIAQRDSLAPPDSDLYWEKVEVKVEPGVPPAVVSTSPEDGDRDVPLEGVVRIVFSAEMNRTSTEAALSISPDAANYVLQWGPRTLTLERLRLSQDTEYTIVVGAGASDDNGTPMGSVYKFSFRTHGPARDPVTELAQLIARSPLIILGLVAVFAATLVIAGFGARRRRKDEEGVAAAPASQGPQFFDAGQGDLGAAGAGPDPGPPPSDLPDIRPKERAITFEGERVSDAAIAPSAEADGPLPPTEMKIVSGGPSFPDAPVLPVATPPTPAVVPPPAAPAPTPAAAPASEAVERGLRSLVPGNNYILLSDSPDAALRAASRAALSGGRGMVVTHVSPVKLRRQFYLPRGVLVVWLTDMEDAPGGINPKRMEFELAKAMLTFIREGQGGVLVIDCFEHLVQENGFERSFATLKRVLDAASETGACVIAVVNPRTLGDRVGDVKSAFDSSVNGG
jgi:hypothetical protein